MTRVYTQKPKKSRIYHGHTNLDNYEYTGIFGSESEAKEEMGRIRAGGHRAKKEETWDNWSVYKSKRRR